jgi:hypothetical protein
MSDRFSRRAWRRRTGAMVAASGSLVALANIAMPAQAATVPAPSATLPTVSVTATPSSVTVAGALQSGGVNVVTSDTGVKEGAVIFVLLKPGVTPAEVVSFVGSGKGGKDPNNASKFGSIVFDAEAEPGVKSEAQTTLAAGQYVVLLKAGEKGPPKANTTFTVTASKAPVALPTPAATIRSIEFAFRGPSVLHDGELVRFENEGWVVHMDFAFPVKSKKAAKNAVADLLAGREKQVEKLISGAPVGFAGPLSTGAYEQETITAKPGWYVQVCFMDTQDGRPHTRLGMERIIQIVK